MVALRLDLIPWPQFPRCFDSLAGELLRFPGPVPSSDSQAAHKPDEPTL